MAWKHQKRQNNKFCTGIVCTVYRMVDNSFSQVVLLFNTFSKYSLHNTMTMVMMFIMCLPGWIYVGTLFMALLNSKHCLFDHNSEWARMIFFLNHQGNEHFFLSLKLVIFLKSLKYELSFSLHFAQVFPICSTEDVTNCILIEIYIVINFICISLIWMVSRCCWYWSSYL